MWCVFMADECLMLIGDLLLVLVWPLGVLAHELGHGLVALHLTDGPVKILVGRQPGRIRLRLGRLRFSLQIESARGTGWRGLCVFKATGVPRDQMLILAAASVVSLAWAVLCTVAMMVWCHQVHALGRIALALCVLWERTSTPPPTSPAQRTL
jgi:hypothetical protein